jgi:hypothetical protein
MVGKGSKVKRDPVELGNVTKKIHNAIMSVLILIFLVNAISIQNNR